MIGDDPQTVLEKCWNEVDPAERLQGVPVKMQHKISFDALERPTGAGGRHGHQVVESQFMDGLAAALKEVLGDPHQPPHRRVQAGFFEHFTLQSIPGCFEHLHTAARQRQIMITFPLLKQDLPLMDSDAGDAVFEAGLF